MERLLNGHHWETGLAFLDEMNGLIRVFDIEKREITNLLSSSQGVGTWSPDGRRMIIPSEYQGGDSGVFRIESCGF